MKKYKFRQLARPFLIYCALIILMLITIIPFLWLVSTAFKSGDENIFQYQQVLFPQHITFENFMVVLQKAPVVSYFINSVIITVLTIALNLFCSTLAAYPLARMSFKGKNSLFLLILLSMMIPFQVMMVPLYLLCLKLGLTDSHNSLSAYLGLILPFSVSGFGIFMMRDAFAKIPLELEQSATLDGCGSLSKLLRIFLPLLKPHLTTLAIFTLIATWGEFLWPSIILTKQQYFPLPLGLVYLQSAFSTNWRWVASGTIWSILPVLLTFILLQRYFIRGALQGAVKG